MIRYWGRSTSINGRKVEWMLGEVGVAYERIDTGREFGGTGAADFVARNPNRLVPVLEDDGLVLWESNVIIRYLAAKYAPDTLYPLDLGQRFDAERWMDWQQTTLNPAGRDAFVQLIRTAPAARDVAAIERSQQAMTPLLDLLDAHLQAQPFMAGDRFTMADIPIACEVHRWSGLPLPTQHRPALQRWYDALRLRPAAAAVLTLPLS